MTPITLETVRPNGADFLTEAKPLESRGRALPSIHFTTMKFQTRLAPQFIDLTALLEERLEESGVREGYVLVYSRHTTAGILINENEPLLIQDMSRFISQLASSSASYEHNDFDVRTVNMCEDECANGHAHCQHLALGSSEYLPVKDGKMTLGQWQRVFLVELDRPRPREVCVQILGI